ncbi:PCI domain-containing protein [Caenorhabditis elegans]|uniref:PCI domain-containing protein n=1 Tax=Caenorhabditis elegans TaxID=6239 RepID=Q20576_CAEEL|nr:PCI domain-containing protein [Caenorhabditis elegans]CAA93494.2 PCI domain-containing protein [Caenorhabditis elegans]|eukprot:NP_510325.2 Prion-like-(Q/N-rich)-domain-bearing protein [Caenorhabditis elegans]
MSAKQDLAPAPATVSHADTGLQPLPPQHQTHPPNYHQGPIIYQQSYAPVAHYQQGPQVWNQPPQSTVHYVQYAPPIDASSYQENKVQSYNHYGTVHYAQPMDNGDMLMRPQQATYVPQQYVTTPQWYPAGQQTQTQFIPSYATTFNVANDPTYHPNHPMNRGGAGRRDDYHVANQSSSVGYMQFVPFVAPIGVMETQAHASASYTANWVSSTSSIPPEMKDEPESDNISQYDGQRPTSQLNGENWTDAEDHLSPTTVQNHPFNVVEPRPQQNFVEKEKSGSQSTTRMSKNSKGDRNEGKRELTFDERLHKARMQKSRVENEGVNGATSPTATTVAAPSSNVANSSTSALTPRSNGQKKETSGSVRNEGSNNNSQNRNTKYRGAVGNNQHMYNGNEGHSGAHEQPQQQQQQRYVNYGNATGERERQPRRDNNYSKNRYENNYHNNSSNNQRSPYQAQNQQNQPTQQNQHPPREGAPENYRQQSYRGNRGGRGAYRGGGYHQPHQQNLQNPLPQQQPLNQYPPAPQIMGPQMVATMNAFQNANIGTLPPGVQRIPLLPGPFGMPRQVHQDIKFQNTWLDATSCPLPLAAVMSIDTRFGRGGMRGRGRGVNYTYRGAYRGGYTGGYAAPPRYIGRPVETPATPKESEQSSSTEVDDMAKKDDEESVQDTASATESTVETPADQGKTQEQNKDSDSQNGKQEPVAEKANEEIIEILPANTKVQSPDAAAEKEKVEST